MQEMRVRTQCFEETSDFSLCVMVHVISTKFSLQSKCNITDSHYSVASAAHLGIKHTLDVLHQFDCLGWFGVVDERGLFEA